MTDAPQIDDLRDGGPGWYERFRDEPLDFGRRFERLWVELLVARFGGSIAVGIACAAVVGVIDVLADWSVIAAVAIAIIGTAIGIAAAGLPTAIARRDWRSILFVGPPATIASMLAMAAANLAAPDFYYDELAALATAGAVIGLAEGMMEKSIATLWAGISGGMLCGWVAWRAPSELVLRLGIESEMAGVAAFGLGMMLLHPGIGLSLALGRYIRDLPKRKRAAGEPTE